MEIRAIVPSAGRGRRLSADGLDLPKVLHKICGRELISLVLDELSFIDPRDIYVVTGYKRERVEQFLAGTGRGYRTVYQKDQLGTGHAVAVCAPEFEGFSGTVLVTFGDMPLFRGSVMEALCARHAETGAACTLLTARNPSLDNWARVTRAPDGRFSAIVEGRDCTPEQKKSGELFAGVLAFDSKLLFETLPRLSVDNAQHEYYLTEVPGLLAAAGYLVETYETDDPDDLCGVNSPEDIAVCEEVFQKRAARGV